MIEVRTGLLFWALEAAILAALLLAVWVWTKRERTYLFCAAGFVLHGLGLAGVGLRDRIPDMLSIDLANALALMGVGLWLAGVQTLNRRPVGYAILIPPLVWMAGIAVPAIREALWARVALYQAGSAAGFVLLGIALLHPGSDMGLRRLLAGLQFAQVVNALAYIAVTIALRPTALRYLSDMGIFSLLYALGLLASLALATRLILLGHHERLHALAETDPLTGALNRRGFATAFDRLNAADEAQGAQAMTALIQLDLDHFKRINDRYGHEAGDMVLVKFATLAGAIMDGRGVFGRLGGEEFACALSVSDADEAVAQAALILEAARRTQVRVPGDDVSFSASAGLSLAPRVDAALDALLGQADRALYAAKNGGRDRIGVHYADHVQIVRQRNETIVSYLREPNRSVA